jgi:predicted ABC-type ATPase
VSTPTIYLIGGSNGAGKTTFAMEFLPKEVKCLRFLNADEIARGLSPFDPAAAALKAGRILLEEFHERVSKRESFSLESTLSGKTYARLLQKAKSNGYEIELHYLVLTDVEQAIARVANRVKMGGHHVPAEDIRRRFERTRENLVTVYLPIAMRWTVWRARNGPPELLATSGIHDIEYVRTLLV